MTRWETYPEVADAIDARPVLGKVGLKIASDARRAAPVLTGALRRSISTSTASGSETVYVTANPRGDQGQAYAAYVELGTRYMAAQPYLRPAAYRAQGRNLEATRPAFSLRAL